MQRDLSDCVAMHRTLMRAFPDLLSSSGAARAEAGLLYRVEPTAKFTISLVVQSRLRPDWLRLPPFWHQPEAEPQVKEITEAISRVEAGRRLRFKLLANPTRKISGKPNRDGLKNTGKRVELVTEYEWLAWLERKALQFGFRLKTFRASPHLPDVRTVGKMKATGFKKRADGARSQLTFYGVVFEGCLEVVDISLFRVGLTAGIGSGKAYGYGLLSIAPWR